MQKWGPKSVLSFSMLGTAALFLAAPGVASVASTSARKATALMTLFATMGLVQGTLAPALSQVNRSFLPGGIEQVWALRAVSQAHQLTPLFAALVTPRLAVRGWRLTCYTFAGLTAVATVVWQLFATNAPKTTKDRVAESKNDGSSIDPRAATRGKKSVSVGILCVAFVWSCSGATIQTGRPIDACVPSICR